MIVNKILFEKHRFRQHYTSRGKSKEIYNIENDALRYISKHKLYKMTAYFYRIYNNYYIGHSILQ